MSKPAIKPLLENTIIKRSLLFLLFAGASIFASEIELIGNRVFIVGEGDIEFQLKLSLSNEDTLNQGGIYTITLQQTGVVGLSGLESLDIGTLDNINPTSITFEASSTISGPAVLDTIIIQASTLGIGGTNTSIQFSGSNIVQDVTSASLELHTLGIEVSEERMVVGQTEYDPVEITLTDENGVGIFTENKTLLSV